jgi:hypothetical protein
MSFEAEGFDAVADGSDLFFGGVGLHDDKHRRNPCVVARKISVLEGAGRGQTVEGGSGDW